MISWISRRLYGIYPAVEPVKPVEPEWVQENRQSADMLAREATVAIAARLTFRAELHEQAGELVPEDRVSSKPGQSAVYPARCAPLDREAAQRILRLMRRVAQEEGVDPARVDDMHQRLCNELRAHHEQRPKPAGG